MIRRYWLLLRLTLAEARCVKAVDQYTHAHEQVRQIRLAMHAA